MANRLGEIHSNTNKEEWYWTPGKLNIADWVTRGKRPDEIDRESEWQGGGGGGGGGGAALLAGAYIGMALSQEVNVKELPEKIKQVSIVRSATVTLATRIGIEIFSKFQLLINTTARILGLYQRYKKQFD